MLSRTVRWLNITSAKLAVLLTLLVLTLFWLDTSNEVTQPFIVAPLHRLELLASDLRFRMRGTALPGPEVVIAAVDEQSLDELGRWPWPYTIQAQLIRRLTDYGAAAIGYDVVFSSSDTSAGVANLQTIEQALASRGYYQDAELKALIDRVRASADHDKTFAAALQESDRTILGYFFHWECRDLSHLSDAEQARFLRNLTVSNSPKYSPRVAPGADVSSLQLNPACGVESNLPVLSQAAWGNGFFNSRPDSEDGTIRHYPLMAQYRGRLQLPDSGGRDMSSPHGATDLFAPLGIRLLERYLVAREGRANVQLSISADNLAQVRLLGANHVLSIPVDTKGRMVLNYLGPSELEPGEASPGRRWRFPRYSIADIVQGRAHAAPPEAFRDKIVLIGAVAVGLSDLRSTPFDPNFPGVETHATAIDNVLRQQFLEKPEWGDWFTTANIIAVGALLMLFLPRLGPLRGDLVTALLLLANVGLNYLLFAQEGWLLNVVYPMLATALVWFGMTIYHFVFEQRQSRFLQKTFSTYISPELVNMMVTGGIEPRLGGSSGLRTAYFTDIASFSSFSEVLNATQLVELLNEYLSAMTDILVAEGGTLDKYEGDAIVAFFGAPIVQDDHAARAVRVALQMQAALAQLRDKWRLEGDKWPHAYWD